MFTKFSSDSKFLRLCFNPQVYFWRDKQKHEVDFILRPGRREEVLAIECKSHYRHFDPSGMRSFRRRHPKGKNLVVSLDPVAPWVKSYGEIDVEFVPFESLPGYIEPGAF